MIWMSEVNNEKLMDAEKANIYQDYTIFLETFLIYFGYEVFSFIVHHMYSKKRFVSEYHRIKGEKMIENIFKYFR